MGVLEDLSELAVGLGNGAVFLFSGDMIRERTPRQILLKRDGPCVTCTSPRVDERTCLSPCCPYCWSTIIC
jgi:hypothetical protein